MVCTVRVTPSQRSPESVEIKENDGRFLLMPDEDGNDGVCIESYGSPPPSSVLAPVPTGTAPSPTVGAFASDQ